MREPVSGSGLNKPKKVNIVVGFGFGFLDVRHSNSKTACVEFGIGIHQIFLFLIFHQEPWNSDILTRKIELFSFFFKSLQHNT